MVSIYKRGKKLYLQYIVEGKRRQKSTGLDDTLANRKLLKSKVIPQLEAKIASGELTLDKKPVKFDEYAQKYIILKDDKKTAIEIAQKVELIMRYFNGRDITTIKRGEIREFATHLLETRTPKTVRNYIGVLKGIFDMAIDYEAISVNPAKDIKLPQHKKAEIEPFTPAEVERLILNADGWFKNFLAISFYTGMRTGEVLGLMQGDIDFAAQTIRVSRSVSRGQVTTPKTSSGIRTIPMFDIVKPYIKDQMSQRTMFLFTGQDGEHLYGADSLRKYWRDVCKRSRVNYRKIYSTRHTFITAMLKSGTVSIMELAQIVGHANSEPIMKNYARFITGEQLKLNRALNPFGLTKQPTVGYEARI